MLTVKIEGFDRLKRNLDGIKRGLGDEVETKALNKTGDKARVEMRRAITDEYNLKASEVTGRLRLMRAARGKLSVVLDPFASFRRGRSLNLIHFLTAIQAAGKAFKVRGARGVNKGQMLQLNRQLGFRIKRAGGLKTITGAFVANKGRTVFIREGKARYPIKALSTIDVPGMFGARKSINRVMAKIRTELPIEMDRAVKFLLAKFR